MISLWHVRKGEIVSRASGMELRYEGLPWARGPGTVAPDRGFAEDYMAE